jgi:hypothetical protein
MLLSPRLRPIRRRYNVRKVGGGGDSMSDDSMPLPKN